MKNLVNALFYYEFEQRENSFFLTGKLLKKCIVFMHMLQYVFISKKQFSFKFYLFQSFLILQANFLSSCHFGSLLLLVSVWEA